MCMILIKPKGKTVPMEHLDRASVHNKDGFGWTYVHKREMITTKTLNYDEFIKELSVLKDKEVLIHMRAMSAGEVSLDNVQPIDMGSEVFCHNGTIFDLAIDPSKSDSVLMASLISDLPANPAREKMIELILRKDRAAIMDKQGKITLFGVWKEEGGIMYSSDYYKETCSAAFCDDWDISMSKYNTSFQVAVYGTLKEGYGNHRLLEGSKLIGKGTTALKYPMVQGYGFPYVYDEEGVGENIHVEVYEVTTEVMDSLDRLEGVDSGHYTPALVDIDLEGGVWEQAEMYFACHDRDQNDELIACWEDE